VDQDKEIEMPEEYSSFYEPPPETYAPADYGPVDTSAQQQMYDFGSESSYPAYYDTGYQSYGSGAVAEPSYSEYGMGGPSTGVYGMPGTSTAGDWLSQLYQSFTGGGASGSPSGGATAGPAGPTSQGPSWLSSLMSIASGAYGMSLANKQRQQAKAAIAGSAPWTASGGTAMAGDQLKSIIGGDFTRDAGFRAAQDSAARTSSQQPGGFAASAAAQAALKYQNDRIQALGPAAGVGFAPSAGYQIAGSGTAGANQLASQSLGSIGYGLTGPTAGTQMPPWLQSYLVQNGLGGKQP
jgi:hypothetical protein